MTGLSDRERRLIAVLILVAMIAIAWLAVLSPILAGFEARAAERERLALVQASNQRLIDNVVRLRRQAEAQKADAARFHIIAPTPAAASEQLKDRIAALIGAGGGEVRALADVEAGEGRIELRIEARLPEGQLAGLLERLQNAEPLMIVTALTIAAPGADPAAQASQSRNLDVRIDVAASHSPA
ncbi:type II secretion system protein GspM [Erythrobacter donghaensis]|jgi:type II secretory pathway component PulM|uniref:type II secretion system protein GspM n=1 Tax=Erythrobacter donghaensis TaxID=267135 RepID=UPI000939B5E9|nr:type II secretion system protein GspM [Erythrobacter donghaensis]